MGEAGGAVSVVIVGAGAEDVAEIVAMEREAVEAPHWPEAVYREMIADVAGESVLRRHLLVARCEGVLAGFAVGKVLGEVAELENVVVAAWARRMGVGRALCGAVVNWAWEQGAAKMELEVRRSSAGARALYRELGFAVTGERRGYYRTPPEDAVLMLLARRM